LFDIAFALLLAAGGKRQLWISSLSSCKRARWHTTGPRIFHLCVLRLQSQAHALVYFTHCGRQRPAFDFPPFFFFIVITKKKQSRCSPFTHGGGRNNRFSFG
jgi:hypothetical protein